MTLIKRKNKNPQKSFHLKLNILNLKEKIITKIIYIQSTIDFRRNFQFLASNFIEILVCILVELSI